MNTVKPNKMDQNWAIFGLTSHALQLGKRIQSAFPNAALFTSSKWADEDSLSFTPDFKSCVAQCFGEKAGLIFIMATGIVVRTIAPLLKDKTQDPAVVVIDEKGEYVISLLSGHIGGANEMAKMIASKIDAKPIITTSSDLNEVLAVDLFAIQNGLIIKDMIQAKDVTALLVEKKTVALLNHCMIKIEHPYSECAESADALIVVSNRAKIDTDQVFVHLIPQNLVVGIGCRKGVETNLIIDFITKTFEDLGLSTKSIKYLATIDLKQNETGIIGASNYFNAPMKVIERTEIVKIEHLFTSSNFVKSNVGVSSVCEPAAYLAGGQKGEFILRKTAFQGITLAVFEMVSKTDFQSV